MNKRTNDRAGRRSPGLWVSIVDFSFTLPDLELTETATLCVWGESSEHSQFRSGA